VSKLLGKLPKLRILDAFSASGVRGIRYWLENDNVESVTFLDIDEKAVKNIAANLKRHGLKGNIVKEDFLKFRDFSFNFVELDPFGSPAPYVNHAIDLLRFNREAFISVTATDTAVLCGKHWQACLKNYWSKPKRDKTCHETAARILLKFIAQLAWLHDFAFYPLLTFYYRHQIKVVAKLVKGKRETHRQLENLGFIYEDEKKQKYWTTYQRLMDLPYAGPLWVGKLHDENLVKDLPMGDVFVKENHYPPFHYNVHELAKHYKLKKLPPMERILEKIPAVKTHFSPLGIKFRGKVEELVNALKDF
jgi:tRNA (guanine26-N2/guanine27-N2)-dimethyltransferase